MLMQRKQDATANSNGDVTNFHSNGDGTFRKGQVLTTGRNPSFVLSQDINADHRPDLIVSNQSDETVAVLLGNGDGSFQSPVPYTTGAQRSSTSLSLVDFDQDGLQDLAVA